MEECGTERWSRSLSHTHMHTLIHIVSAFQLWSNRIKGSHGEFCACEGHFLNIYVQMLQQLHYVSQNALSHSNTLKQFGLSAGSGARVSTLMVPELLRILGRSRWNWLLIYLRVLRASVIGGAAPSEGRRIARSTESQRLSGSGWRPQTADWSWNQDLVPASPPPKSSSMVLWRCFTRGCATKHV